MFWTSGQSLKLRSPCCHFFSLFLPRPSQRWKAWQRLHPRNSWAPRNICLCQLLKAWSPVQKWKSRWNTYLIIQGNHSARLKFHGDQEPELSCWAIQKMSLSSRKTDAWPFSWSCIAVFWARLTSQLAKLSHYSDERLPRETSGGRVFLWEHLDHSKEGAASSWKYRLL